MENRNKRSLCSILTRQYNKALKLLKPIDNKEGFASLHIIPKRLRSPASLPLDSTRVSHKIKEMMGKLVAIKSKKEFSAGRRVNLRKRVKKVTSNSLDKQRVINNSKANSLYKNIKSPPFTFVRKSMNVKGDKALPQFLSNREITKDSNSTKQLITVTKRKEVRNLSFGGNPDTTPDGNVSTNKLTKYLRRIPPFMLFNISTQDTTSLLTRKTPEFFSLTQNKSRNQEPNKAKSENPKNTYRRMYRLRSNGLVKPY